MVELTVDGKTVAVPEGSMVMQAANELDIYIPHFCYHKKLSIAANCRMCLVDVEKAPKPLPACATPVTAGMVVRTQSPKAIQAQKGVMEFLLINHPLDCPICDQGGECQLQDLAVGYGASSSRYEEEKRVVFHKSIGPLVSAQEMTRCIHCTRCVRFGQEIAGVMELGMLNRGEHSQITAFLGTTVDSELSGNMIDVCPVGALTSKPFRYSARPWELARRRSVSPHDNLGSNLIMQVRSDRVMRVLPLENEAVNECWLSDRDRFSYLGLNSDDRLTEPMIRQSDGSWLNATWNDALSLVATRLKAARVAPDSKSRPSLGALAAPHATLEEFSLLRQLMDGLGCDNRDFRLRERDHASITADSSAPWLGLPISRFGELDRILVIGSFLRKDHPLFAQRLRQAAKEHCRVSLIHVSADDLLMPLAHQQQVKPDGLVPALERLLVALADKCSQALPSAWAGQETDDQARALAQDLFEGKHCAVLLGAYAAQHPQAARLRELSQAIVKLLAKQADASEAAISTDQAITTKETQGLPRALFGQLTEGGNALGAHLAGFTPRADGLDAHAMLENPLSAYVVLHADPSRDCANGAQALQALRSADFTVALTAYRSEAQEWAKVMLPIAPFSETSGTFVNGEGRIQSFSAVTTPRGQTRPAWKVLRVLGNLLELEGFQEDSSLAVRDALLNKLAVKEGQLIGPDHAALSNSTLSSSSDSWPVPPAASALEASAAENTYQRVADVPLYAIDPIVRHAPALQQTRDARRAANVRIDPETANRLGLKDQDTVRVRSKQGAISLPCLIDTATLPGTLRVSTALPETLALGDMFGDLTLEKV